MKNRLRYSAVLYFQNDGRKCLLCSILASLHPSINIHYKRVSFYKPYFDELNINGFNFINGFKCGHVHKFEGIKNLSINFFELVFHLEGSTKLPIHFRQKRNVLLDGLQKIGKIKQNGSKTPHEEPNYCTTFLKPLTNTKKIGCFEIVFDATHPNSNTEQSSQSWALALLATQLARTIRNVKSAVDLFYAYAYATLDHETIKL